MEESFNGAALRLARMFNGLSLDETAILVGKSRQYIHKLEVGSSVPTVEVAEALARGLKVLPTFFRTGAPLGIGDEQVHFRKLMTTRTGVRQVALAKISNTIIG